VPAAEKESTRHRPGLERYALPGPWTEADEVTETIDSTALRRDTGGCGRPDGMLKGCGRPDWTLKGRGHLGGDPGRVWPPPRWPGSERTAEGAGERRVSWREAPRAGGRDGDAGNVAGDVRKES
jgi:hypothetical protein